MVLLLGLICFLAAIALLGHAVLSAGQPSGVARSLEALQGMTLSPAEVAEEVEGPFSDRVVAPLQERALTVGRRITGADQTDRIRRKLDHAGNPMDWTVDRVIALKVMAGVIVPILALCYCLLIGLPLPWTIAAVLAALALGFFGPDLFLYNRAQKRADLMRRTLADSVDLLTISVEAGLGFDAALQQVATRTKGPIAEEFARVLREMQLGMGRSEALKAFAGRTSVDELQAFVGAMVQADAFGIPVGKVLRVQAQEMRLKRRQHAEARAQMVPVKIMVPLVVCILPCLFVVVMAPVVLAAVGEFSTL